MRAKRGSNAVLTAAVTLLSSMLIAFGGAFAWLMAEGGGAAYASSVAAVLFPPRDLDGGGSGGEEDTEQLYNMEVNAAVTHSKSGSYYNVTINSGGVTLKNKTVLGDLIISESAADGEITLQNIVVRGDITVKGGGRVTLDGVTAVTLNAERQAGTEFALRGETTVYQLNAVGRASIDERGLERGYYGIKRVAAGDGGRLENVRLLFGTVEHTVKEPKDSGKN